MECSKPGAIRDEDLIAYLAGEKVDPAVIEHLAQCQRCSAQLATYRRTERNLSQILYRWNCPANQVLGEYQLGLLDTRMASAVSHHLQSCALCSAEVAALAQFLMNDPMLVERSVLTQTRSAGQTAAPASANHHHPAPRPLEDLLEQTLQSARRLIATLMPAEPRLGLQRDASASSAQTTPWPRRYAAADVTISLQLEHTPAPHTQQHSLQLLGFVNRTGTPLETLQGTTVQLLSPASATPVATQTLDDLGNFVFSSLTPAIYNLELQFPEGVIVIDQLPLDTQE